MVRRAFCWPRRAALTLTLLLVSQVSLAGQVCLMAAATVTDRALSTLSHVQSRAPQKPFIDDDAGCCVHHNAQEMMCAPSGEEVISASFPSNWPTPDPAFPGSGSWSGNLATAQLGCLPSDASATPPHPPFSILFCRYLN
jgi:hypothetical protein